MIGCQSAEYPSTWSVVAGDPNTGEVGVAAASCLSDPIDAIAALVPGKGAAATQSFFKLENRNHVFEALQMGNSAETIIASVTAADNDAPARQYGVITMVDGSASSAAHTGIDNLNWAGDAQGDIPFAVTVQGNVLESKTVVDAALAAFSDPSTGPLTLSDRLMRAMEAGSAAGGDQRCNIDAEQTAAAAFIMVAQGDEAPFAVERFGESLTDAANAPALYLSVSHPVGGANPMLALREQYDTWRATNLPSCADCDLSAIPVPAGGTESSLRLSLIILVGIGVLFVVAIYKWQRRKRC